MDLRRLGVALAAGTAAFLLVGVAVTAALEPTIEFSLFIGLPAGFVAGVIVIAFVAITLTDPNKLRYSAGVSTGVAGITILLTTVIGVALRYRFSTVLYTATFAGAVVGVVAFVLATQTWDTPRR